ncbi:DNA topoisomerase I [Erysipelotrichaceae bacterium]|nr:DNA topoisomerase I [Erysipelotrichaceae bacterium]
MKHLVIVESPAKSKTIEGYLGKDFIVTSSVGHIRDLATTGQHGLGVDVENGFEPTYKTITGKAKVVRELKKAAKEADVIYLATDPDREGEAISWHLAEILGLDTAKVERVVFNEITKKAVQSAFDHPRKIDINLVHSQEARRILDRIIGFRLSKLLQSKIKSKSAGRVQSVALRLIVEREREIEAFIPEEYWEIYVNHFMAENHVIAFKLAKYKNKKIELKSSADVDNVLTAITNKDFIVESITSKNTARAPKQPFITARLQQEAASKLGFTAKKTMSVAQKLYEGMKIGSETVGLITYMRTDSVRLSDDFVDSAFDYIISNFGKEYKGTRIKSKKADTTQDAHEAIRPTAVERTPEKMAKYLEKDEFRLYELIWSRTIASLMSKAKLDNTKVILENNLYTFQANGQILKFEGYLKVYKKFEKVSDEELPLYVEGVSIAPIEIANSQHFTQPPARYGEASLVKVLEEQGIGRPSTYATIIDTIQKRGYVNLDQKRFFPSEQGILTSDNLTKHFEQIINVDYTAKIESDLDSIARGEMDEIKFLEEFYQNFVPAIDAAYENMEKIEAKEVGKQCPDCASPLVVRRSRYGEFIGCSNYPECKYIEPSENNIQVSTNIHCPKCAEGEIIEKKTRRGKIFFGCNKYPDCDFATWYKPIDKKCPKCESILIEKGKKITCSSCDYIEEE